MIPLSPSSPLENIVELSLQPELLGEDIRGDAGGEIGARILFALQAITGLIAIPIILFVGILETTFYAITCQGKNLKAAFQKTISAITGHTLVFPLLIIKTIAPKTWAQEIEDPWLEITAKVITILSCSSNEPITHQHTTEIKT